VDQEDFEPGDVVELKSGGIPMTTQHRAISDQPDEWICVWFEGATLHEGRFNGRSLRKVRRLRRKLLKASRKVGP
jgi:uncharacterized protein YodC (DUF2158 family)